MRARGWAQVVIFSGCCAGCAGVLPPARVSVSEATDGHERKQETPVAREMVLRASLDPQQLFESQTSRVVDFGAGYRVAVPDNGRTVHGPIGQIGLYPIHVDHLHARFGLDNVGELLFDRTQTDGKPGWGYTLALSAELTHFVSASRSMSDNNDAVAYTAHGEYGSGLFVGLTHRILDGGRSDMIVVGFSVRMPAAAFLYVCGSCVTR
jgi:hypothetical protein